MVNVVVRKVSISRQPKLKEKTFYAKLTIDVTGLIIIVKNTESKLENCNAYFVLVINTRWCFNMCIASIAIQEGDERQIE